MIIKSKRRRPNKTYQLAKLTKLSDQVIRDQQNSILNQNNLSLFKTQQGQHQNQQLRGGGFAMSSCRFGQAPQAQEIQNLTENMTLYEQELPENFKNEFDDSVNDIKDGFRNLFNNSIKNKIIIRIQWFSYNKNILNKLCIQSEIKSDLKNKIIDNLKYLLDALPNYLEVSWFLSYQIAQICNDLLRILYSQQLDNSQDILKKVNYFSEQLTNGSDNIWKGGLEFEKTLMEIMLNNLKEPGKELDLLIKMAKGVGESILEGKITKKLLSSLKKGAKYLAKKIVNKGLYPIEIYQTYYLFQIIKWRIIETESHSVYSAILTLKSLFQQYIQESNNWILHFCWIQTITDIILYRPIIEKNLLLQQNLQEITMIQELAFDHKKAIILFFDQQLNPSLNSIISKYKRNELQLLCQSLIDEQFANNQNLWDYYTNFRFISSEKDDIKQNNIIQVNREQELLKKLFEQLKVLVDQIQYTQIEIKETLIAQVEKNQISKQLFDDHKNRLFCKYFDQWKKAIYIINMILDFLNFDYEKLKILENLELFRQEEPFSNIFKQIQKFFQVEFQQFYKSFLNDFFEEISFISNLAFQEQKEIKINNQYSRINIQENLPLDSFISFLHTLNELQILIESKNDNDVKITHLNKKTINEFFEKIIQGNWIRHIAFKILEQFQEKFQFMSDDLNQISEIRSQIIKCQISIQTISFLKQFYEVQIEKIKRIKRKFWIYLIQDQQQNQMKETSFIKRFSDLLKKQQNNLTTFREIVSKNFNVDIIRQNFEQIDLEIEQDIKTIKIELQKVKEEEKEKEKEKVKEQQNETEKEKETEKVKEQEQKEKQEQEQEYKKGIKLLLEFQALFIIFLRNTNEPKNNQQEKSENNNSQIQDEQSLVKYGQEFLDKFDKLLERLRIIIQEFQKRKESESQKDKISYFEIERCEYWSILYETTINKLKSAMKFYQVYKKFLLIYLDLFNYSNSDSDKNNQLQENDDFRRQIINFKNQNIECIDQLEYQIKTQFIDLTIQVEKPNHDLTLIQFLTFFEMEINDQQTENQAEDEINIGVLLEIKDYFQQKKNEIENIIEAKDYKVGECLVYNLIRLQNSNLEDQIINFASQKLQQIWVFEQNPRVRSLLKNKELIDMQKQIFSRDIQTMSDQIKQEIQHKMQNVEFLQQQIRLQGNPQERENLQQQLKLCYKQLDESIDNVSEMSEAMNITLMFLKDISKDVKSIKISIDNLQNSLQEIGNEIRKLRGKKYDELLQIRKQKILQQAQQQKVDSIYVQLQTIERSPINGSLKPGSFLLKEQIQDRNGEVNEFIWHETLAIKGNTEEKDVMLLSGFAGSGKSRAAKKIEEFIWQSQGIQSEWIPIFVSLPTLKNPKYNLLDQALESENYQFDKYQIKEFKDAICKKKAKVVLILDSYDEMKQDCIQQNLIMTNKLIQDLNVDKSDRQLKIIITTRREILNTDGYETWFYGDSLSTLKEVQLLNFNQEQQYRYLEKYCKLSIKRTLRRIYEFVKQVQGQNFDLAEFIKIWNSILNQVKQCLCYSQFNRLDSIFQDNQEEIIIQKIKQQSVFKYLSDEQITGFRKDLLNLWSVNKFVKSINSVNIQNLLTTPFMLEIIVQVLPSMTKKYQGSIEIKENFRKYYLSINKRAKLSRNLNQQFQQKMEESLNNKQQNQINYVQEDNKSIIKSSRIQKTQKKRKIDQIIDALDSIKFFQFYSIDSNIQLKEGKINIDGQNLQVNVNNVDIVVMALKMKKFTAFEFYESFISFYHEQQIQKQRELGKVSNYESFAQDIYQFSQSLALDLTIRDLSQINYKQKGQLLLQSNYKAIQDVDDWQDQYLSDSYTDKEYKKLIRSSILLTTKGSTYQFTHKSIQEFFVAQYVNNFLVSLGNFSQSQNQELQNLNHLKTSLFNLSTFNLSCEAFRGANYFIKDKLLNAEINQKLIDIVMLSRRKEFCRAASNSIYLLSLMNIYLGFQNFSSIQLADTNISGLSFFESDLSNSNFQNVIINSCNFNQAILSDIMWEVICKEKPYLAGNKHLSCFKSVAFSPDGKYIASGGEKGIVKLWDPQTYIFIQDLIPQHKGCIQQLQFSSDSQLLISCDSSGNIKFWDILNFTQKLIKGPDFIEKINQFYLTEDSKKIFILTEKKFIIQEFDQLFQETNKIESEINQFLISLINKNLDFVLFHENIIPNLSQLTKLLDKLNENIDLIVFSPDGKLISVVANKFIIKIFELGGNLFGEYKTQFRIYSLQFTSDSRNLILGGEKTIIMKEIDFFKIGSFQINQQIFEKIKCQEICISPNNNQIIVLVIEKAIQLIDIKTNNLLNQIKFNYQPKNIITSSDGLQLAFILQNEDGHIVEFQILDFNTLKTKIQIQWNENFWNLYLLSGDLSRMFVQSWEKSFEINLQLMNQDTKLSKFKSNLKAQLFCIKPKDQIMAYVKTETQSIILFNIQNEKQIGKVLINAQNKQVEALCFSPTQNILVVGYQNVQLLVWDLDNYENQQIALQKDIFEDQQKHLDLEFSYIQQTTQEEKKNTFKSLIFSPNGKLFAINGFSNLYVYETQTWNLIKFKMDLTIEQISFSHDSKFMVVNHNNSINMWDVENNYLLIQLPSISFRFFHLQMFFTLKSNIHLYTNYDSAILIDISTSEPRESKKLNDSINQVSFSQNNCIIATSTQLQSYTLIRIFDYSNDELELVASQIFFFQITFISFINNDQELLLQIYEKDEYLINVYQISQFQIKGIINQQFSCGAFSKNNQLIALGACYSKDITLFTSKLNKFENYIDIARSDSITFVQFIQDDNLIVSGSKKGVIEFWNYLEKYSQYNRMLQISSHSIQQIKFIKNDSILICLDEQQNLSIFKASYNQNNVDLSFIGYYEEINSFSVSIDGERLIGIRNNRQIMNLKDSNCDLFFIQEKIEKIYFSFCKNFQSFQVTIHMSDQQVFIPKIQNLKKNINKYQIYKMLIFILVQFSAVKQEVIFSLFPATPYFYDNISGCQRLKFTENGQLLVLIDRSIIRWYLVQENKTLKVLGFITTAYYGEKLLRVYLFNSQYLAYISNLNSGLRRVNVPERDENITVLNILEQNFQFQLKPCNIQLDSQQFSISLEEQIVYFHSSLTVYALDIQNMIMYEINQKSEKYSKLKIEHIQAIDNRSLIIVSYDYNNQVRICQQLNWNLNKQNQIDQNQFEIGIFSKKLIGGSYFPKQQLWAVIFENDIIIQILNIKAKKIINIFQGHRQIINQLTFSSDGLILASASEDQSIRLWNIDFIEQIDPSVGHRDTITDIAFSKDGLLVASCSRDKTIILWDLLEKKFIVQLEGHEGIINCLQISYCSKFLYSASEDMSIRVWNIENPWQSKLINIYYFNDFPIKSFCLSPIDNNIFTIRYNNAIQIINKEDIQNFYDLLPYGHQLKFINNDELIYLIVDESAKYGSNYYYNLLIYDTNNRKSTLIKQKYRDTTQIICSNINLVFILEIKNYEEGEIFILEKCQNQKWIDNNDFYLPLAKMIMLSPDNQTLVIQTKKFLSFWKYQFEKKRVLDKSYDLRGFLTVSKRIFFLESFVLFSKEDNLIIWFDFNLGPENYQIFDGIKQFKPEQRYSIEEIQVSFDMKYIAVVFEQECSMIYFWEVMQPNQINQLSAREDFKIITFKFDSNFIYSAYSTCEIVKWNLQTFEPQVYIQFQIPDIQRTKQRILFSSQFNYQFIIQEFVRQKVIFFDLKKKDFRNEYIERIQKAHTFSFSEDETLVAYANQNELCLCSILNSNLIELDTIQLILEAVTVETIKFYQNERLFVQYSYGNQLFRPEHYILSVYEIQKGQKGQNLRILDCFLIKEFIRNFKYDSIKQQLVVVSETQIYYFNILNRIIGEPIKTNAYAKYCFSSDSQYFALLNSNLSLIETTNFEEIQNFPFQGEALDFVKGNENLILALVQKKSLSFLDFSNLNDIKEVQRLNFENDINSVQLTSKYCLIKHDEYCFSIYDIQNLSNIIKSDVYSGKHGILSNNSQFLAYSNGRNCKIINTYTKRLYENEEQDNNLNFISQSPSGQYFAIQQKNSVKIIEYNSFKIIEPSPLAQMLIDFSENWKYMAFCDMGKIKITEIKNECQFLENQQLELHIENYSVLTLSLSLIGNYLASGNVNDIKTECKIFLWDVEKCKLIAQSGNLDSYVQHIKFCPDGLTFAAALENGPLHLYQIKQNFEKTSISCFKSIAKQSNLLAHQCILSKQSQVQKSQNSIIELFKQKGAIVQNN
ncbi:unnamed protein product [Paramecium sonneborni]|uniref:NACHT domain-containing protein n=1 Tax=Paramecium sonneborni TaxID=65129 RepID=A0A8S1M6A1_9CILI|nr:unnamed protein product [Paramecium sonneborni]